MSAENWDRWDGSCAPDLFSKDCSVFTRPQVTETTHGVRGAAPLPPNAAWVVTFDKFGSHACVGVATATAPLTISGYGDLFGASSPPDSWVLRFGTTVGNEFLAAAGGTTCPILPIEAPGHTGQQLLAIKLRLEAGRKLYAVIPGGSAEQLLFDSLPQDVPLFAVAESAYGGSQVAIRRLRQADEEEEQRKQQLSDALKLLRHPCKGHYHGSSSECLICPSCHLCTGWGGGCAKVFGKSSRSAEAGKPCGCGQGPTGCDACGLCITCSKQADMEHFAALGKAAALLGMPLPHYSGSCPGKGSINPRAGHAAANSLPKFPDALDFHSEDPRSLVELRLLQLAGAIRDKPRWTEKLRDPEIASRWRTEAAAQGASEEMLKYVFEQLAYEAQHQDLSTQGGVQGVFTFDGVVPDNVRQALLTDIARLEALPPDWHPGSNQQVLDLVHPSLFCLAFGVTKQLPEGSVTLDNCISLIGSGTPITAPKVTDRSYTSTKTQWIPTNFQVDDVGCVRPLSYINNLHPVDYAGLYETLSQILGLVRPLFERVLGRLLSPEKRIIDPYAHEWYDEFQEPSDEDAVDDAHDEYYETRQPKLPPVPETFTPPPELVPVDLRGHKLQVIVKLANIVLTPDKPRYNGGTWHVEGMKNEKILATAIYYYEQENITESHLAFRTAVEEPDYEQNDNRGVEAVFGLRDLEPLNQVLGQVTTLEGRCLCFPNIYQHQVQPFELKDKSKPGHRKILVFFLSDPAQSVLSTSEIPPQQAEWWQQEVLTQQGTVLSAMPAEVIEMVGSFAVSAAGADACPFSLECAHDYREQLMQERKFIVDAQNEDVFEREFSLCEH